MSKDKDFLEFKSTCDEISRQLDYDCGWDLGVKDTFNDIKLSVGNLVFSRNRKIAELEKRLKKAPNKSVKKSPKKSPKKCPPGKVLNPKTNRCIKEKKKSTPKKRGRPKKSVKNASPQEFQEIVAVPSPKMSKTLTLSSGTISNTPDYGALPPPHPQGVEAKRRAKECPPGKVLNPKTNRCIKEKKKSTPKKRGRPKKSVKKAASPKMPVDNIFGINVRGAQIVAAPKSSPKISVQQALERYHEVCRGGPAYKTLLNTIKKKFGVTLKYDNHGDPYAMPDLYLMKGKKECSGKEAREVREFVIDHVKKHVKNI
jgi:hypothetical protein